MCFLHLKYILVQTGHFTSVNDTTWLESLVLNSIWKIQKSRWENMCKVMHSTEKHFWCYYLLLSAFFPLCILFWWVLYTVNIVFCIQICILLCGWFWSIVGFTAIGLKKVSVGLILVLVMLLRSHLLSYVGIFLYL